MTDGSGIVQAQYAFDSFGRNTKLQGSLDADFQYAGYYTHQRSALNLTIFRAYSALMGRWISRDPIGEGGGPNLYAYVFNKPVEFVDPAGLAAEPWKDCNRICPDGSLPIKITRAALGTFYICRGDAIITPGTQSYNPTLDNAYAIAKGEGIQATRDRQEADMKKFEGMGSDVTNAIEEAKRRAEQERQRTQRWKDSLDWSDWNKYNPWAKPPDSFQPQSQTQSTPFGNPRMGNQ